MPLSTLISPPNCTQIGGTGDTGLASKQPPGIAIALHALAERPEG